MTTIDPSSAMQRPSSGYARWGRFFQLGVVGIVAVAAGWGVWTHWIRNAVTVRPADSTDKIVNDYAGINAANATIRNIAVITGRVDHDTWFELSLFAVRDGAVQVVNQVTAGSGVMGPGTPRRVNVKLTLALGEYDTPQGRATHLGCAGYERESDGTEDVVVIVPATYRYAYRGTLTPGHRHIIYVQGTQPIHVGVDMTLDQFAHAHRGDYLVVTAELR